MQTLWARATELVLEYGINLLGALLIFVLGRLLCSVVKSMVVRMMAKSKVDPTVINFVGNITYWATYCYVIISALSQLGLQTGSIVAIFGAAGLAIGLALQGSLSNFAAGVMIIIFKPFKVGDAIEAGGVMGKVTEVQIFNTVITTPDNRVIFVPNSGITGGNITNMNVNGTRRLDITFGVSYDDDIDAVKTMIQEVVAADERVLSEPEPTIAVSALADSSVNFVVRPWAKSSDLWPLTFALQENLKKEADKRGFTIPYPQQDVHMHQVK